ncbi:hypothetical protein N9515_09310 [Vicingaceae bacterium]|nr:hypothetical protein [Vicingaceae bacterium]
MNEQLIKFIELCLVDGVISDKEREVIFRKSKELGVPDDECEIILKGMIQQKGSSSEIKEEGQNNSTPKSVKSNFQEFIDKHKNDKNTFGKNLIVLKTEIKNQYSGWSSPKELKDRIDEKYDEIVFGFKNSIIVLKDGSIISNYTNGSTGKIFSYEQVLKFTLQEKGFVGKGNILFDGLKIGNVIGNDSKFGYQIFKDFQNFLKENPPTLTPVDDEELGGTNLEESIPVTKEEKERLQKEKEEKEIRQNGSNNFESILDTLESFDNPFEIIRHIKVSYKGSSNYHDLDSIRDLIKPKMFRTNIWNTQIREQLIKKENTPQGQIFPLGNVSYKGTILKRELLFGIIDGDEGILFFPPANYSPLKKGFQSRLNYPDITIINGKKELLSGKPSPYDWDKLIQEIKFDIFKRNKQTNEGYYLITFKNKDNSFIFKYTDSNFRLGRSSHTFDSSHEYKLSFNSPLINDILSYIGTMFNNELLKEKEVELKTKKSDLEKKTKQVDSLKKTLFRKIDKDNNGEIDIFEGEDELNTIIRKNQDIIQGKGDNYIKSFIKIKNYLDTKKSNIKNIFDEIKEYSVDDKSKFDRAKSLSRKTDMSLSECKRIIDVYHKNFNLKDSIGLLENQIYLWNLLFFHSLNMIDSLIRDDKITFYEIYEKLDKLGIFNSTWETEVSERLKNVEEGISDLILSVQRMESNLILELQEMSYVTSSSIDDLNHSVSQSLESINSSVKFNNLLTGIQTYQMYKINQNTKGLRK